MTARYRNRTAEVEAVQWTGDNAGALSAFCSPFDFQTIDPEDRVEDPEQTAAVRESEHGTWRGLAPGDWVVKRGLDLFECSAADFAKLYEPAAAAVRPPATDRTAVCICGHTEQQHFEDVCITEITACDCGDFIPPNAAREVIARWREAATRKPVDRAAVLREGEAAMRAEAKRLAGEFNDSDILHEDGPASAVATWKQAAALLGRLAAEPAAVSGRTDDETGASCPDPIECGHEAALGEMKAKLARVREWATSHAVTARTEFGEGYRACQRDVRDLIDGRIGPAVGGAQPKEA
jgi:hypothetical protein